MSIDADELSDEVLLEICRVSRDDLGFSDELLIDLQTATSLVGASSSPRDIRLRNAIILITAALAKLPKFNPIHIHFGTSSPTTRSNGWIDKATIEHVSKQIAGLQDALSTAEYIAAEVNRAIDKALKLGFLESKDYDAWRPGMESGSGWRQALSATVYGVTNARAAAKGISSKTQEAMIQSKSSTQHQPNSQVEPRSQITTPPFSDSKELNAVFADIEQCLQTLEALSSHYDLLSSLERAGKVRDMVGSIDGMQFTSEDNRRAHDDAERQINAAAKILYKPLTRVFAWGRDQRLDLPFDGSELTSQIPYSWRDEDENRGHYEYYAFICEQYQSELDRISKALAVVVSKDSVAHIVLDAYSSDSPTAIAEVTMLTLDERQIVLQTLKKATPALTLTFRVLYEDHLLPADLILFQQRRDSLQGEYEGWKFYNYESEDDDTFNAMWNAEDFIKRVIARRPTGSPLANPDTPPSESCDSSVADGDEGDTMATMENKEQEDGTPGLSPSLSDIPELNTTDGSWVKCKLAAKLGGITTRTLSKYRSQGESTPDKMAGRDPQRRLWRKEGTPNAHPWYLRTSLPSQNKSQLKP